MHNYQGYFSRTFQVLEFSRKNPGLSRRRGNRFSEAPRGVWKIFDESILK